MEPLSLKIKSWWWLYMERDHTHTHTTCAHTTITTTCNVFCFFISRQSDVLIMAFFFIPDVSIPYPYSFQGSFVLMTIFRKIRRDTGKPGESNINL